ncbi:Mu transposase C-terminal domain-containing protein [Burkholderia cepacia]|uniref:Mu transposase C-terminal domain-containing protein n=1 Tax=Burkholderia cepacia TaxID=292 RepID=UPI001CF4CA96|nr:Mu transposase C-terminal domain-containing protein [Burkholderia cepacia]MCA8059438.1 Mu transposase C-terminal domain-containing protein [Burkholderia cepacia]
MTRIVVKSHYSAAELAAMALPDVPRSSSGIFRAAKAGAWMARKREGRGGGLEYALDSLPADAQAEIRRRASAALVASVPVQPTKAVIRREQQLQLVETDVQRLRADARKGILSMLDRIMTQCRVSREAAMHTLLTQGRLGTLDDHMTAMLRAAKDSRGRKGDEFPSIRTLKRYLGLAKQGSLAPKIPKSSFEIPEWATLFLEQYQQPQKPSVGQAYREFEIACAVRRVTYEVPSIHQVRRFLDKLGAVTLQTGRMGSRELKTMLPFIRRTFDKLLPNDIWSGDGHTFDAEVQHPLHGRPFRPEITSIIDVATRRAVGISLDLAESSFAVLDALSTGVLKCGVPSMFYVDNGSGYKNALLKDEGVGVQGRLGFVVTHSIPYNSQARGVVERLHQTLWVAAAKKLPSYMGADMDRQAKHVMFKITRNALKHGGALPLMSWEAFIQFCQEQVDAYNDRPHSTLPVIRDPNSGKRRHMSPNEAWAMHVANGWQPDTLDERDARTVFRPRIKRTVARGEVRLLNHHYSSPELIEFHGEEVQVAYDINDARFVWIYALDGRYVCQAEVGANERDYMPQSAVEQAREKRADARANRLQVKLDEVEAERRGQPALTLETPEIITIPGFGDITRDALNRRFVDAEPVIEIEPTAMELAAPEPLEPSQPIAAVFQLPETPELRFARWQTLNHHIETGGIPDQDELQWYGRYALSKEFAAQKRRAEQAEELQLASHQ